MAKGESFFKGIVQYSISTWVNLFLGVFSVMITTRLLTPDVYGLVAMFFSVSSVMLYVLTLGMDGAYIRFYNEPPGNDTKNQLLYKNIVISLLVCVIAGVIVTLVWGDELSGRVFGVASRIITGLLFVYTFIHIILRYLNISFRMSFRVKQYTLQNVLINCLSKILVIIAAIFTDGFIWIIFILTIGMLTVLLVYFYSQRKEYVPYDSDNKLNLSLSLSNYGEYLRFALFSAPTYIVYYLNTYASQQLIRSMISAFSLGIFSSTTMFGALLGAVKGGFSTFWSAYVYQNYKDDHERIGKMHDFVVVLCIAAVSVLVCFRDILYLFIGIDYHSSKAFFSLLLVMPVLSFLLETTDKGIALAKKNHINLATHILAVIVNIVLCYLLIPKYQLMGAAWASAVSAITLFLANTIYGQKYYKTIANYKKSSIGLLILLAILSLPAVVFDIKMIILGVLIIDVFGYLIYKTEVLTVYKMIKSRIPFLRK